MDDGHLAFDFINNGMKMVPFFRVEPYGGFIQQKYFWISQKCLGNSHPPYHPAGQFPAGILFSVRQMDDVQYPVNFFFVKFFGNFLQAGKVFQLFLDC